MTIWSVASMDTYIYVHTDLHPRVQKYMTYTTWNLKGFQPGFGPCVESHLLCSGIDGGHCTLRISICSVVISMPLLSAQILYFQTTLVSFFLVLVISLHMLRGFSFYASYSKSEPSVICSLLSVLFLKESDGKDRKSSPPWVSIPLCPYSGRLMWEQASFSKLTLTSEWLP